MKVYIVSYRSLYARGDVLKVFLNEEHAFKYRDYLNDYHKTKGYAVYEYDVEESEVDE